VTDRIFTLLLLLSLCWNCAQQSSPTGGPRDETPPAVVESIPPNYSTYFNARKIQITFDEYLVLDNVNQQLVVSPPMEKKPEVKLRKKSLIIQIEDTLKENTTYTFNFGNAIKDLHEGNRLLNFEYVFSTGPVLDSLSVKGTLKYAEDLSVPDEPVTIMLYDNLRDSVPLTDIPLYVARSGDSGVFSVNNLRADTFKVFALKDGNYNLLFDLPTEEIAFLDTSLIVNAEFARSLFERTMVPDSTREPEGLPDTLTAGVPVPEFALMPPGEIDTVSTTADTLEGAGPDYNSIYIDLLLFTEEKEIQYIVNDARDNRRLLQLAFARPLTDSFRYRFLTPGIDGRIDVLEDFSAGRDSLNLWLIDSLDYKRDTITLGLSYTVKDTSQLFVTRMDTLLFTFRERKAKSKKEKPETEDGLRITTIRKRGEHDLNKNLLLDLNVPLKEIRDSLIHLYKVSDSVEIEIPFRAVKDPEIPTRGWIEAEWESITWYRLLVLPGAVESIYDLEHDTIDVPFRTRDTEFYGRILLGLQHVHNPVIIQLISRDQVIRQQTVETDGQYEFAFLQPREYTIKFIHDLNGNGRWDTGNYLKKQQPEPVEFVEKPINVRSNWDHEVNMIMQK
jgi:hypothetical protein